MANHASRGRARRIQSRTKLFVCPTVFAAPVYHDPTRRRRRWWLKERTRVAARFTGVRKSGSGPSWEIQSSSLPSCTIIPRVARKCSPWKGLRCGKERVKINSFIRVSYFPPSSQKNTIFIEIINKSKVLWFREIQIFLTYYKLIND